MADDDAKTPEEASKEEAAAAPAPAAEEKAPEAAPVAEKKEAAPAKEEAAKPADSAPAAADAKPADAAPTPPVDPKKPKDIFAELDGDADEKVKILKAKGSKNIHSGIVHVRATFNNTMVTISDMRGNVIGWSTSGKMGFRGSRKSTAYAGQVVSQDACKQAMSHGLKEVEVRVTGPGSGREAAVRAVQGLGIAIHRIEDVTPIPHNGCRPPKPRRV